jgi:hypothetical protein
MGLLDWLGIIGRGVDIVDKAVLDKDQANELKEVFRQLEERSYQMELETETIPWIDGLHKMGRQIISLVSIIGGYIFLSYYPDVDPMKLATLSAPGGIYAWVKGKGK